MGVFSNIGRYYRNFIFVVLFQINVLILRIDNVYIKIFEYYDIFDDSIEYLSIFQIFLFVFDGLVYKFVFFWGQFFKDEI